MGCLYVAAIHIGNYDDITVRAARIIKTCDVLYAESEKECSKLLRSIDVQRDFQLCNEHTEEQIVDQALSYLKTGKTLCLVSDAGTPCFEDPGRMLVRRALDAGLKVSPIPGPSSFAALLSVSGTFFHGFHYFGLLPRKREERETAIISLSKYNVPVIFCDTPYRLSKTLQQCHELLGNSRTAVIGYNISLSSEIIYRGTFYEMARKFQKQKGEFVVLLEPLKKRSKRRKRK